MKDKLREAFTPERIVQAAKAYFDENVLERPPEELLCSLSEEHVVVDLAILHYGMKDKNPVDSVKFYGKRHPDGKSLYQ